MAKVTINVPEPVEASVTLELTLDEARVIRDVMGMTYGNSKLLDELYTALSDVEGYPRDIKVYRDKTNGRIRVENSHDYA